MRVVRRAQKGSMDWTRISVSHARVVASRRVDGHRVKFILVAVQHINMCVRRGTKHMTRCVKIVRNAARARCKPSRAQPAAIRSARCVLKVHLVPGVNHVHRSINTTRGLPAPEHRTKPVRHVFQARCVMIWTQQPRVCSTNATYEPISSSARTHVVANNAA